MLDGSHSVQEIRDRLTESFPEMRISTRDVHALVSSLHNSGLLISEMSGQATPLRKRREKELRQKAMQLLMSVMSLRLPGVDPERFLNWLYPKVRWLLSPAAMVVYGLISVSALLLILNNADEFYRRLPEFSQFFNVKNLLFMAGIMIVTKSIHELGHGIVCKHYGGECHEIGFMFLVMTPAMYCNTSDSWILPNKWHRIAIGAAGMGVELVMASVCAFIWWYTHPGPVHYFALNVIFLCSVTTILFNANPLLRYDGYYMLADYLEIPNLAQKSKTALVNVLRVGCLGMKPVQSRMLPQRNKISFASYAVASFVYRWFVMLMIFWFLAQVFEPYGLEVIGHGLIVMSLVGMVVIPLFKVGKFFLYPGRLRDVKMIRLFSTMLVLAIAGWALCCVPVSRHVSAPLVIQPVDAETIYIVEGGTLRKVHVEAGETVTAGDPLAELANDDLRLEHEQLIGQLATQQAELGALRASRSLIPGAGRRIGETQSKIADLKRRLEIAERKMSQLTLVAGRDGVVIPPPNRLPSPRSDNALVRWSGTPLDRENVGAFLPPQTLFALIGDAGELQATLIVDQSDAQLVEPGQKVELMLDELPGKRLEASVAAVSRDRIITLPRQLSITNGGKVAAKPMGEGVESPLLTSYEVHVPLTDLEDTVLTGFRGHAKIRIAAMPLGQQLLRYLRTVVNFR